MKATRNLSNRRRDAYTLMELVGVLCVMGDAKLVGNVRSIAGIPQCCG